MLVKRVGGSENSSGMILQQTGQDGAFGSVSLPRPRVCHRVRSLLTITTERKASHLVREIMVHLPILLIGMDENAAACAAISTDKSFQTGFSTYWLDRGHGLHAAPTSFAVLLVVKHHRVSPSH